MKAIKIDVVKREVYAVEVADNIDDIYKQIEAEPFDVVWLDDSKNVLYVDGEAMLRDKAIGAFYIQDYPNPLIGHGLILGVDEDGVSADTTISVDLIRERIYF